MNLFQSIICITCHDTGIINNYAIPTKRRCHHCGIAAMEDFARRKIEPRKQIVMMFAGEEALEKIHESS